MCVQLLKIVSNAVSYRMSEKHPVNKELYNLSLMEEEVERQSGEVC